MFHSKKLLWLSSKVVVSFLLLCSPLLSKEVPVGALQSYAAQIESSIAKDLNLSTGTGTGQFILNLQNLARAMRADPRLQSANPDAVSIQTDLMSLFEASPQKPRVFKVDLRPEMIEYVNERLKRSGFGFIQVGISKKALLLSHLYDLGSPKLDRADLQLIAKLSAELYSDTADQKVIRIPHYDARLLAAVKEGLSRHSQKDIFIEFKFELDSNIKTEDQVALPNPALPLKREETFNRVLKNIRLALVVPLGLFGSAFSGGWSSTAWAGGASVLGQEANFIRNSGKWNQFWQKFGLQGNIAMNMNFAALVTTMMVVTGAGVQAIDGLTAGITPSMKMAATVALSVTSFVASFYALKVINYTKKLSVVAGMVGTMAATVLVLGHYANINLPEFLVKSLVISTATFVASFGLGQILLGRLNQNGELGEGRRFPLESYLNFFGAVPRTIALGAAALAATQAPWFNLNDFTGDVQLLGINWTDIKFAKPELYAWITQLIVFGTVGLPLLMKTWKGDAAIDRQTQEIMLGKNSAAPRGLIARTCDRGLAWIAKLYTPRWSKP